MFDLACARLSTGHAIICLHLPIKRTSCRRSLHRHTDGRSPLQALDWQNSYATARRGRMPGCVIGKEDRLRMWVRESPMPVRRVCCSSLLS